MPEILETKNGIKVELPMFLPVFQPKSNLVALDDMLNSIAEQYDVSVKSKIEGLAAAIEPILTIIIGVFLLIFALSIFLPMWRLIDVVG